MTGFVEYDRYDALGLAELVRSRRVSAEELLDEAIARAERVNPTLNALIARCYEGARAAARSGLPDGPFTGVPFVAKDLGPELAGLPMTMGSRYFSRYVPAHDDEFFTRVKRSGLNIFGKSSTPEFGLLPYTEPVLFGACRNPWNPDRTPGGSSGGSAALCAAGVVPMAHANDMGGSIRIPASCTGLFGLKPSRARVPSPGGAVGDPNVDLGLTRTVRDSAALLDAVRQERGLFYQAPPPERPYLEEVTREPGRLRIAVVHAPMLGHGVHPGVRAAVDDAARLCESLGHTVDIDEPAGIDYTEIAYALLLMFASKISLQLGAANPLAGKPLRRGDIEPPARAMLAVAHAVSADNLATAIAHQRSLAIQLARFMERYDVILTPTLAAPPVRIGELALTQNECLQIELLTRIRSRALLRKAARDISARMFDWLPYPPIFNLTGQPAMSVPLAWSEDGLPIGMQFAARYGDEATLYRLAGQLERARPWRDRRPPLWSGEAASASRPELPA